jgi:hypothetical protein
MPPKMRKLVGLTATLMTAAAIGAAGARGEGDRPTLALRDWDGWATWWRRDTAPVQWNGEAILAERVTWRAGAEGVEWGELQLRGSSEAWRTRVIVARLEPRQVRFSIVPAFTRNVSWTVANADSAAVLRWMRDSSAAACPGDGW